MSKQITIVVQKKGDGEELVLLHDVEKTVLETLRENGIALPSLCNGRGTCGRCKVQFKGSAPFPTPTERGRISPDELREGYRLSCVARPMKECSIQTSFEVEEKIKVLTESAIMQSSEERSEDDVTIENGETVIAVDLGTTTIAMQLLEVSAGRVLDTYTCLNPQRSYGMDVVERIRAGSEGNGEKLRTLVREAIMKGRNLFVQAAYDQKLRQPELLVIACNTAMGHLFMGYPTDTLGKSPFRPVNIELTQWDWDGMRTVLLPGISAFVGGDIVAGLYASNLHKENVPWIFLDLGTNAEMAAGRDGCIFGTAAAAGPAFEGTGDGNTTGPERISALAHLLKVGSADETGLLQEPYFETGITVDNIFVTQKDIRDIQMAKAAVRTGIHFLKGKLKVDSYEQIGKVYLAGGFGFYLDQEAAVRIGLIPPELKGKLAVVGNTALSGAGLIGRKMVRGSEGRNELDNIVRRSGIFNLAEQPNFEEKYISYINF